MTGEERGQVTGLTKGRVEALTDGIFAFAMTLLVTTLDFPNSTVTLPPLTVSSLVSLYSPDLLHYVIAFAVCLSGCRDGHSLPAAIDRSRDGNGHPAPKRYIVADRHPRPAQPDPAPDHPYLYAHF